MTLPFRVITDCFSKQVIHCSKTNLANLQRVSRQRVLCNLTSKQVLPHSQLVEIIFVSALKYIFITNEKQKKYAKEKKQNKKVYQHLDVTPRYWQTPDSWENYLMSLCMKCIANWHAYYVSCKTELTRHHLGGTTGNTKTLDPLLCNTLTTDYLS